MKDDGKALDSGEKPSAGPPCPLPSHPQTLSGSVRCQAKVTKGQAHGFHSEPPPALHLQQEGRWGSGVGAFHLSRQILPVAEAFSVKDVGTGLQLPFIIEPVGNVQDGGVRPGGQEEEEEQDQGLDYFCLAL